MEQGGGVDGADTGGAGGTAPAEAEASTAPAAPQPQGGTVPADAVAQDEPGQEKAAGVAGGGKTELETALTAPELQDGWEIVPGEEALAVQHDGGQAASEEGQAASIGEKVPAASKAQGVGKDGKDKPEKKKAPAAGELKGGKTSAAVKAEDGGKDEPREEKPPAEGEPEKGKDEPMEEKGLAVIEAQGGGKDEPKKEQAPGESGAENGGKAELMEEKTPATANSEGGKAKPMEETALAAAQTQDGGNGEPAKEETTMVAEEKVPAAAKALDEGKQAAKAEQAPADTKPAKEKTTAAAKEKTTAAAKEKTTAAAKEKTMATAKEKTTAAAKEKTTATAKEKTTAAAKEKTTAAAKEKTTAAAKEKTTATAKEKTMATAKEKTTAATKEKTTAAAKEKAPAVAKEKAPAVAKEKAPAVAKEKTPAAPKAPSGDNNVVKAEKAPAVKKTTDGGKEEPMKEKAPAPVKEKDPAPVKEKAITPEKEKALDPTKAQDGEKAGAKAEKTPAAKMAPDGGKKEPVKEKAPAVAKVQDGEKKTAKVEKSTVPSKAGDGGKDPAKEKILVAAKAQDGGKKAAEVEPPTPGAEAGDGAAEPTEAAAMAAVKAQGEGENVSKDTEGQPPSVPEAPRPALLQSLSCPAACHRGEQPWAEVPEMETIEEETTMVEPKEGPTEPGPGPPALEDLQPSEPPNTPQERTLQSATGQPPDPAGVAEQPGPGEQPSLTEAKHPPSPYLTSDFGKEDPFEILDDVPPPPAPFAHRTVTLRSASVSSQFSLNSKDILGGGKFGEVHTCTEKETGLKLAAKVIRKQGAKDKEMVLLEIDVMNQLNHHNLIQLYDAIETPREIILFMEFVEGGELFERIIDDDYHLTEVDCMVFVRQICEGIRFMHHMCVLHLDLKPENILCVSATGHMVKIIDFGLARRYNPDEKLKVNFGTPEFLSPEVVNYEQVSYSTDMWSMGVITYMLLSGLSPFLGDDDTETLNNVLAANWYFDEETFESVSDEAKDFVSNLIIKDKSARMSADQCLQHPWLNNLAEKAKRSNRRLKSQVLLKKYVMRRRWKKNFIGVCAANRFRKITSSGSLTALGI